MPPPAHSPPCRVVDIYTDLYDFSCRMLEAAQANDWDKLATLEREQAGVRNALQQCSINALSPVDAEKIAQLIRQTLDNDTEIRRHVEPWMNSARKLLASGKRSRAMRAAYSAIDPR